ncbi:MAG: glycosyltransferase [Myxococcales bacterium]|nr:glycosyltransferase [Myxococcales bacterium]
MKRVLFVVLAEKGHVHPFIGPAQELRRRGHAVGFYSPSDLRRPLARAGFDEVFVGATQAPPDGNRGAAFAALVDDPARLRRWIGEMLVESVPREVERLTAAAAAFRPHVIVADPMAYAAPIVAERRQIPWAGVSTSLNPVVPDGWTSELIATTSALPREELLARFGVAGARFRVSDCLSPWLNVAFTTRELVGEAPDDVLLAGASVPLDERGDEAEDVTIEDDRPVVYMALGSQIWHQPRMFAAVMEGSRGQPWQLVLAAGDLATELRPPPGVSVKILKYAPQLAVLRRARVMITHGGANSVMEALAQGVPLMLTPICNDQPHNARFVAGAGAGVVCDLATASAAEVRAGLARLCADGAERAAARRIAASYHAAGGAPRVAEAIEGLGVRG